ncbi:MAG: hypothetical protein KC535_04455 [Nanoarchaeota archaeon]|nr:hypothetical protein [Nanoarchaeota archaeon]
MVDFLTQEDIRALKTAARKASDHLSHVLGTSCFGTASFQGFPHQPTSWLIFQFQGEGRGTLLEVTVKGERKQLHLQTLAVNDPLQSSQAIEAYNEFVAPLLAQFFKVPLARARINRSTGEFHREFDQLIRCMKRQSREWVKFFDQAVISSSRRDHHEAGMLFDENSTRRSFSTRVVKTTAKKGSLGQQKISFEIDVKTGYFRSTRIFLLEFHYDGAKHQWVAQALETHPNYESALHQLVQGKIIPDIHRLVSGVFIELHEEIPSHRKVVVLRT